MHQTLALFVFSGTGNTWWCAQELARAAANFGLAVKCISIENLKDEVLADLVANSDMIGIAYPIYGSDLPLPMHCFVDKLPRLTSNKPALVFCTQFLWSGDGAAVGADLLETKGYSVRWTQHILMPNNICLPIYPKLSFSNDPNKLSGALSRARVKLGKLAARVAKSQEYRHGRQRWARWLGLVQRAPYRRMLPKLQKVLAIDPERCSRCGLCAQLCPTQSIEKKDGSYQIGKGCALCQRCYNYCPTLAVTAAGRHHETRRGQPYHGPTPEFHPKILRQT